MNDLDTNAEGDPGPDPDPIRRRAIVHGRVQGVWFRASTQQVAREHGVAGWVRNRADGTVEAVVEGAPGAVAGVLAWLHHGPERAIVERVDIFDEPAEALVTFEVTD